MSHPLLWPMDLENQEWIAGLPDEKILLKLMASGDYQEISIDPRDVLKVENQFNQGACQGHSQSSVNEWCYIIANGDNKLQLSRAMAYYESQRLDGIRGDKGSTISSGVKLATDTGICEEKLWTYPNRYDPKRPGNYDDILANAKNYRIRQSRRLTSYDGVRAYLGSGQGAINVGIGWGQGMSKAVIERYSTGNGGHAIGLFSLSKRKDLKGRPYVWMMNSWGTSFGNAGWSEWSPASIEQMFRARFTVMIGCSDMESVAPRKYSVQDWKDIFTINGKTQVA